MKLIKNIIRLILANVVQLASSLIVSFLVPVILSINDYAEYKMYAFYISYVGVLQLGFHDGMYIKYGGKDMTEINLSILKGEHLIYCIFQGMVTSLFCCFAIYQNNLLLFLLGISILPTNLFNFFRTFYQSTGQFEVLSKLLWCNSIMYLLLNTVLVIVFSKTEFYWYCVAALIGNVSMVIVAECTLWKSIKGIKCTIKRRVIIEDIKVGFFIMLGNLSILFFYAIDRWFVLYFLDTESFAFYSFAVSLVSVINILVSSVALVFYNQIAKGMKQEELINTKKILIIIGFLGSTSYFVCAFIVSWFIPKYIGSLEIVAYTFINIPFTLVINSIFVNLYKRERQEKKYLLTMITIIIVSAIYNLIAISIGGTSESIAIATIISLFSWFIYSELKFKDIRCTFKEWFYIIFLTVAFVGTSHMVNNIEGMVLYLILYLLLTLMIFDKEINIVKVILRGVIKQRHNIE